VEVDQATARGRRSLVLTCAVLHLCVTSACTAFTPVQSSGAEVPSRNVRASSPGQAGLVVDVEEPLGVARKEWPVTVGVPFPKGVVRDFGALGVREIGRGTAAAPRVAPQARVLSRWPDGSVRWALLDWPVDLLPRQHKRFAVDATAGASAGTGAASRGSARVQVHESADRIDIDTGVLQFAVPKQAFGLWSDVRVEGSAVTHGPTISFMTVDGRRTAAQVPLSVVVTEVGPQRTRIELRGDYSAAFGYVIRIDAFANQPFVRVLHTFEQHAPQPYTAVNQIGLELPMRFEGAPQYRVAQPSGGMWSGKLPAAGFSLFQEDNELLYVNGVRQPGRARGWVDLSDNARGIAVAARYFWQEYPQSFQLRSDGLTYNLWAPEAAPAKVGMGAAKTHELFVYFHGKTSPAADVVLGLTQAPSAHVAPEWIVSTGALPNSLAPSVATSGFVRELEAGYRRYQASVDNERWDDSGQVYCTNPEQQRPRRGFYGMLNWGDWNFPGYHDTTKGCETWGNLEYDTTQVLALAYAATGQHAFYDSMVVAARHFMDVDRIHYQSAHPNWVGMNHPKDPLHFAFELGGVDLGHTWTEGLLSYYAMTGDDRGLAAARGIADYLVARLVTVLQRGNPRQWGWPQIALVAMYDASGSDVYRTAALEYARRGMRAYSPDDVTHWKMGILAEALSYTYGATHDPAIREWLERYAKAASAVGSPDARLLPAIAYVGRVAANPGYRQLADATVARLQFGGWGKPFTLAGRLGFRILSLTTGSSVTVAGGSAGGRMSPSGASSSATPVKAKTPGMWEPPAGNWQPTPEAWGPTPNAFWER
jgi:exo-rhamnogalacturonan lyase-like protein